MRCISLSIGERSKKGDRLVKVGWVKDAHGLRGEVYVRLEAGQADWLEGCHHLLLKPRGGSESTRFSLERAKPHKEGLIVALDGVLDRTRAESLKGAEVFIDSELLEGDLEGGIYLGQYLGARVISPQGQGLGQVVDLGSNGAQDLLVVENSRGRFDVPLVSAFLREVNLDEKRIMMDLPEGLIELPGESSEPS